MKKRLPDFSKKLLSLSISGDEHTYAIDRPRFEEQAGRLFLIGTVPPGGSTADWSKGMLCGVAWDEVTDYLVFDSAEQYRQRLKIYEQRKRKG